MELELDVFFACSESLADKYTKIFQYGEAKVSFGKKEWFCTGLYEAGEENGKNWRITFTIDAENLDEFDGQETLDAIYHVAPENVWVGSLQIGGSNQDTDEYFMNEDLENPFEIWCDSEYDYGIED